MGNHKRRRTPAKSTVMENRSAGLRVFCSGAVVALVVSILMVAAIASTPGNGQISDEQRTVAYRGGPFVAPNRTDPLFGDGATLQCISELAPCDDFALTVALAPDYLRTHPSASIKVDGVPVYPSERRELHRLGAARVVADSVDAKKGRPGFLPAGPLQF